MKKLFANLSWVALGLILLFVLFSTLHFRSLARFLMYSGFSLFLINLIIALISFKEIQPPLKLYNDLFNNKRNRYSYLLIIGSLLFVAGFLLKIMHFPGATTFLILGIMLMFASFIPLLILINNAKSYIRVIDNPGIGVSVEELGMYCGSYFSEQLNMTMNVWEKDGRLNAQIVGQASFILSAVKKDIFNYLPIGVVIEFYPDKYELILIQQGMYLPFLKL